jgi:hypothetical protein
LLPQLITEDTKTPPPGDPWAFLTPELHPYGFWLVRCPLGCGSKAGIWQLDGGEVIPPFVLSGACLGGCPAPDMAARLAAATGRRPETFMPPIVVNEAFLEALNGMLRRPDVGRAWDGKGKFQSDQTRVWALGHRMREAGATEPMIEFAQAYLRAFLNEQAGA